RRFPDRSRSWQRRRRSNVGGALRTDIPDVARLRQKCAPNQDSLGHSHECLSCAELAERFCDFVAQDLALMSRLEMNLHRSEAAAMEFRLFRSPARLAAKGHSKFRSSGHSAR